MSWRSARAPDERHEPPAGHRGGRRVPGLGRAGADDRRADAIPVFVDTFNNPNLAVPPAGSPVVARLPAGSLPRPWAATCPGPDRRVGRRGGDAVGADGSPPEGSARPGRHRPRLFDKDGTLIDFHAMWGGWARELGDRLEAAARRPVAPRRVRRHRLRSVLRSGRRGRAAGGRHDGRHRAVVAACCGAGAPAWRQRDGRPRPPGSSPIRSRWPSPGRPVRALRALRAAGRRIAVVTTDDRAPTDATLRALGVREAVEAMVCGDDGFPMKPAPDAVFAVCQALGREPSRVAVSATRRPTSRWLARPAPVASSASLPGSDDGRSGGRGRRPCVGRGAAPRRADGARLTPRPNRRRPGLVPMGHRS